MFVVINTLCSNKVSLCHSSSSNLYISREVLGLKYENKWAIYVPKISKNKIFLFSVTDLIPIQRTMITDMGKTESRSLIWGQNQQKHIKY